MRPAGPAPATSTSVESAVGIGLDLHPVVALAHAELVHASRGPAQGLPPGHEVDIRERAVDGVVLRAVGVRVNPADEGLSRCGDPALDAQVGAGDPEPD